jgi:hypothetical protein
LAQLLDLAFALARGVPVDSGVEGASGVDQPLLLPGASLVGVDLVALRQLRRRRLFPHRLQGDLGLSATSILGFVFFLVRSASQKQRTPANLNSGRKTGVHFTAAVRRSPSGQMSPKRSKQRSRSEASRM